MNCPHCNRHIPTRLIARHLGSIGGSKKKPYSMAERKRRRQRMAEARLKRWPDKEQN